MLNTFECQQCGQRLYPKRRVCPSCHAQKLVPVPDPQGIILSTVTDPNAQPTNHVNLVRTQRGVLLLTRSATALKEGQTVSITDNNNELISTTTDGDI